MIYMDRKTANYIILGWLFLFAIALKKTNTCSIKKVITYFRLSSHDLKMTIYQDVIGYVV